MELTVQLRFNPKIGRFEVETQLPSGELIDEDGDTLPEVLANLGEALEDQDLDAYLQEESK